MVERLGEGGFENGCGKEKKVGENGLEGVNKEKKVGKNELGKEKDWYVYLLECMDGSYYCGVTNDIDSRMNAHAIGKGSKYVYRKGFCELLRCEKCKDKSDACKCEYQIKQLPRNEKLDWFD